MCTGKGGSATPCGEMDGNFISLCEAEVDRRIESTLERYPVLRTYVPDPDLSSCCQRDELADIADWETAWAWDGLRFLRGE